MPIALKLEIIFPNEDFTDNSISSAPQLEEVNVETSRSRDLEKLVNRDIDVSSLSSSTKESK